MANIYPITCFVYVPAMHLACKMAEIFFFLRQPLPTVAFIVYHPIKHDSKTLSNHNEQILPEILQYCAWGIPSALL